MNSEESSYYVVAEQKRWRSIRIMYLTLFLNSTGFSILLPSLWPYLQHLSPSVNYSFLGIAAAGYSLGQFIASPIVGKWSTLRGRVTLPVQLCMVMGIIGNLLYALAGITKTQTTSSTLALWFVAVGRVISGCGAGCIAVARSYHGTVTTLDERTAVVSKGSMAQSLGFIIGPGLSFLTSLLPNTVIFKGVELNQYTLPAYLCVVFTLINAIVVMIWFREDVTPAEFMFNSVIQNSEMATLRVKWSGIVICSALFYIAMLSFTVLETLGTPVLQAELGLSESGAVKWSSIFLTGTSVFSFITFALATPLGKKFGERKMMGLAFFLSALAYILFYPMGPGHIPRVEWTPLINSTANMTKEVVGCRWQNKWCYTQLRLSLVQYIFANSILLFSYPLTVVLLLSRVTKILGPHPQGTVMGVLTAVGSLSRCIGPAIFSTLFEHLGPLIVSVIMIVICLLACVILYLGNRHMHTFEHRIERLNAEIFT